MSKRGSIFKQGERDLEYEDLDDREGPVNSPKKATAAQMATRKIKAAKGSRRPPGATSVSLLDDTPPGMSSKYSLEWRRDQCRRQQQQTVANMRVQGISSTPSFSASQPSQSSGFTFGSTDNRANANPFTFLSQSQQQPALNGSIFGTNATNSFPPAQPSTTQSNPFTSSSFPSFGASQPSGFTFGSDSGDNNANANPFTFSSQPQQQEPAQNGSFFGSNVTNSLPPTQPPTTQSDAFASPSLPSFSTSQPSGFTFGSGDTSANANPFGFLSQSQQQQPIQPTLFGTVSAAPIVTSSEAPASASFSLFSSQPAQNAGTSSPFSIFGASTAAQESTATSQPTLFSTISAAPLAPSSEPPASAPFSIFGMTRSELEPARIAQPEAADLSITPGGPFGSPFQMPTERNPGEILPATEVNTPSTEAPTTASSIPQAEADELRTVPEGPSGSPIQTPSEPVPDEILATPSKQQAPLSPASMMPNLTGTVEPPKASEATESSEASKSAEIPKIAKVHVPQNWSAPKSISTDLNELSSELARVNNNYRAKLAQLPATADWTSLSQWHQKETSEIMKRIATVKKQMAAAKGITGKESSLSTKRKVDDGESERETQNASPSKKPRGDAPSTPKPNPFSLFSTTPKASPPPATQTSSLFGNILNKGSSSTSDNPFAFKASEKKDSEPSKKPAFQSSFGSSLTGSSKNTTSQPPFQFGSSRAASTKGETKLPSFSSSGSGGFLEQFSKKSKTVEELKAERMEKAKVSCLPDEQPCEDLIIMAGQAEDYDSDEETEEQWEKRWKDKEAEREANAKEKSDQASDANPAPKLFSGFSNPVSGTSSPGLFSSATPKATSDATSAPKLFSGFSNPVSGTSTPGLFSSRVGSPAPSNGGGKSVFDTPEAAQTPTSNIFGHLSSGPSSNNQDEDDDEEEEEYQSKSQSQAEQTSNAAEPKKRKLGDPESESEESLEEAMRRKKSSQKPSLLSRMTKDEPTEVENNESEKEEGESSNTTSIFGKTNGIQTPASKPFKYFDFSAAAGANSAPPKQDTFAGDQTFKPGTPIKFGTAMKEAPTFQFQPATPGPADFSTTPSKPGPATFSFLNAGQSGPASIDSSVLSSRAPTPLSEAETSGKETAAETEDDEGPKQAQVDFSALTDEEVAKNDVLFETEQALAKQQVEKDGAKTWENYARGPLWILKNKETGKALVRIRTNSGAVPLNYYIYPKLQTNVTGNSKKMVSAIGTKKDGKGGNIIFAFKTTEMAVKFSKAYNESIP